MPQISLKSFWLNNWTTTVNTKFMEPGGDATFNVATEVNGGFWSQVNETPAVVTDFVHGTHIKSIKYRPNVGDWQVTPAGVVSDSGSRISFYIYLVALPAGTFGYVATVTNSSLSQVLAIKLTSTGVLQIHDASGTQIGTDGSTLSTGQWYRLCLAYTITSTSVNEIRLFVDSATDISISNATLGTVVSNKVNFGNGQIDTTLDFRSSDHYIDDSAALTDTGDVWVTAKRPNADGTLNEFDTQIGVGGSGYGSGHTPQVNERPLDTANGWSEIGAGSAATEEYTVESASTGDIDISTATLVDWGGWIHCDATVGEIGTIIAGGTTSTFTLSTANRTITKFVGSTTYPAGGNDVGLTTDTTVSTANLYEAGVMIAFIPGAVSAVRRIIQNLLHMGVG